MECRLLDLPAELRNDIYRLVVLQTDDIVVSTEGINEPPLLKACKQIRVEALPIYYAENSFELQIRDCNSNAVFKWEQSVRCRILLQRKVKCKVEISLLGTANWQNLREWLKRLHAKELHTGVVDVVGALPQKVCGKEARMHVVGSMFRLVSKTRSRPWEDVDALLEDQHKILAMLNERWR